MHVCRLIFTILCIFIFSENQSGSVRIQTNPRVRTITYHGIRADDTGGRCGLPNPERGFRLESYIGQPPGTTSWGIGRYLLDRATSGFSDDWCLMNMRRFHTDGVTLTQAYCYLTDFIDKPISQEKLNYLQRSLHRCRKAGIKLLLRFAYEKDMTHSKGPAGETILMHLDQLAPLIKNNSDIIYVLQAGFVGAWGEWHSSARYLEENHPVLAKIVKRELSVLPENRMIQLRVLPRYKRWILEDPIFNSSSALNPDNAFSGIPAARLGFANDGFLAEESDGGTWPEPPFYANPGNPEFDRLTRESPYLAVDGELFWSDQGGPVDGLEAARRLHLHHYTSFGLTHSNSAFEDKRYSIDLWKEDTLLENDLHQAELPVSDGYFTNYAGRPVTRTVYEYIRDHLGYRLELQQAQFPENVSKEDFLPVEVELINRGFATLINPRFVYFVLINTSGVMVLKQKTDVNPQTWQPFDPQDSNRKPLHHKIRGKLYLKDIESGEYMLGVYMPDTGTDISDDARYAIQLANRDTPWWTTAEGKYGVNILGPVSVLE